ncbi:hypothetical protein [Neiella marina]|nr:hypothetical protein [Neiella marina]
MKTAMKALSVGIGLLISSLACQASDLSDELAHSTDFQQSFAQARLDPLALEPTHLNQTASNDAAIELAVLQHMQHLAAQVMPLTEAQRSWAIRWQNSGHQLIQHTAELLITRANQRAIPSWSDWLVLSQQRQLYWLSRQDFPACAVDGVFDGVNSTVLAALALRCERADLLRQVIARGEREATLNSLREIPQRFDQTTAKQLLVEAAKHGDLAVAAMPVLAIHFGPDADVQQLMVDGLYDERIGPVSAVSLAKYGSQQTLQELHRKLQLKQLDSPADRFAKLAIERSGYVLEPLALHHR